MRVWGLTVGHRTVHGPQTEGLGPADAHRIHSGGQPRNRVPSKTLINQTFLKSLLRHAAIMHPSDRSS